MLIKIINVKQRPYHSKESIKQIVPAPRVFDAHCFLNILKNYTDMLPFLSALDIEMAQVVEINPHVSK